MIWIVAFVLVVGGAVGVYIFQIHWKNAGPRKSKRFRNALVEELKITNAEDFNFNEFVSRHGIKWNMAVRAAEDVYATAYHKSSKSGQVAPRDRKVLDGLVSALRIRRPFMEDIERRVNQQTYRHAFENAKSRGQITSTEFTELKELRETLGLSHQDVREASGESGVSSYQAAFRSVVAKGPISKEAFTALAGMRRAIGLTEVQAYLAIREEALGLYRERLAEAKQDGRITQDQEDNLQYLQMLTRLSDGDVERFTHEIRRIRFLDDCRNGHFPKHETKIKLHPREICHWDGKCGFAWRTPGGDDNKAKGRLTITDIRVVFSSLVKNFDFRIWRIVDVRMTGPAVQIKCVAADGTGYFYVDDVALIEAVIYGLVRLGNAHRADNLSSNRSRFISQEVKRRVWRRDGGRCVRCEMQEDIQFDHLVPFSKGGENTFENIRLLCQQCNLGRSH